MLELNSNLIEFDLPNSVTNKNFSTDNLGLDKPSLIMFICNHCPYVIHYHEQIQKLTRDFEEKFNFVAISSNDVENYPQDSPEKMKILWEELSLTFPYLYDETQDVAKKYKAECTPEFYVFNANKKLVYRGRFDDTSPGSDTDPNGEDLRSAMQALIDGQKISDEQFPSMGCNIKWK
jgi:thiol-disulfide isomerase/thioredoxin